MSEEKELTLKDAVAVARSYKTELNRRMMSLAKVEDVLTKAMEVGNLAYNYEKIQNEMHTFVEESEKKKVAINERCDQLKAQRNGEPAKLDREIAVRRAEVTRLGEQVKKLTGRIAIAEQQEEVANDG
jgi:hypothetical protein